MENKKFEKLIDLIINENEEQARELFHEIVVEKSREIYENIMDEEMMENAEEEKDLEEAAEEDQDAIEEGMEGMEGDPPADGGEMVGEVGDLMDEISAEESGMTEEDEVFDLEGGDDMGDEEMGGEEGVEDAVIRIEDKLDQLMAEFEEIMAGEEDMGDEEVAGDEEEVAGDEEEVAGDEEMMESVQLQKVAMPKGGDNGQNAKSPTTFNSGQAGMDSKPVKFSGAAESVPTSPKGPSNFYSKGETQVKGAGQFKNAPGHKGADLSKAPSPKKGDDGANTKSIVAK